MEELNWFEKLLNWILTPKYDCKKGNHKWIYWLSDTGCVYLHDGDVPKEVWKCENCGIKKYPN